MNWWLKLGCFLTGWNSELLAQSSEASKTQLRKYTSAILILMIIWSITGFCFAQRYIGLLVWGCAIVSLIFMTIVIMIERQIILALDPSKKLVWFRVAIAVVMAFIGSAIFDQTMFGKDIDKQMADNIEVQTASLTKKRVGIIDKKLQDVQSEKYALNDANAKMQSDVNNNPWIKQTSVTNSQLLLNLVGTSSTWIKQTSVTNSQQTLQVNGRIKTVNNPSVTTNQVPNPKIETIKENNAKIKQLDDQEKDLTNKKLSVEDNTRKECQANVGFLEELEAMVNILSTHHVAIVFYLVFFGLLMSLELFVVVSKIGDKECDYEMAVKRAQTIREMRLNATLNRNN